MLTIGYMALALLIGMGLATQVTMISAMGRLRGPLEATWVSLLATVAGFTLIMAAMGVVTSVQQVVSFTRYSSVSSTERSFEKVIFS